MGRARRGRADTQGVRLRAASPLQNEQLSTLVKLIDNLILSLSEFFARLPTSDMATIESVIAELSTQERGCQILEQFPKLREQKLSLSHTELQRVVGLLDKFIASDNSRSAPTKKQLWGAVNSLLPPSATTKLSSKWDKSQLAFALRQWVMEAIALSEGQSQTDLFLEVKTSDVDPKEIAHDVFILDDDGSVATFSVTAPSPSIPVAKLIDVSEPPLPKRGTCPPEPTASSADLFSPESTATSASSFVRQLNELVDITDQDLAAIPTVPHPRVRNSLEHGNEALESNLPGSSLPPATSAGRDAARTVTPVNVQGESESAEGLGESEEDQQQTNTIVGVTMKKVNSEPKDRGSCLLFPT